MKNDMNPTHAVPPELTFLLGKAAEFHGHLGPFLVIGVRIGLIGLKKIGKHDAGQLGIEVSLPLHVPFSCIIDGLQVSTNCTVGNQKLSFEDCPSIQVTFERKDNGQKIVVALNQSVFEKLKSQLLQETLSDEEIRNLAWKVAAIPEDELFVIT